MSILELEKDLKELQKFLITIIQTDEPIKEELEKEGIVFAFHVLFLFVRKSLEQSLSFVNLANGTKQEGTDKTFIDITSLVCVIRTICETSLNTYYIFGHGIIKDDEIYNDELFFKLDCYKYFSYEQMLSYQKDFESLSIPFEPKDIKKGKSILKTKIHGNPVLEKFKYKFPEKDINSVLKGERWMVYSYRKFASVAGFTNHRMYSFLSEITHSGYLAMSIFEERKYENLESKLIKSLYEIVLGALANTYMCYENYARYILKRTMSFTEKDVLLAEKVLHWTNFIRGSDHKVPLIKE